MKNLFLLISICFLFSNCKEDNSNQDDIIANIACFDYPNNKEINIGDTVIFKSCTDTSNIFSWYVNNELISHDKNLSYFFNKEGEFIIKLVTNNLVSLDSIEKKINAIRLPDNIRFIQFDPEIKLNSVRSWNVIDPINNYRTAIPNDSAVSYSLDVNFDSFPDLNFNVSHYNVRCGREMCTDIHNYINPLNNAISFSIVDHPNIANSIDLDGEISISSKWSKSTITLYTNSIAFIYFNGSYIGIKINNNYGWINLKQEDQVLIIKGFAINLTDYNPIKSGQKN